MAWLQKKKNPPGGGFGWWYDWQLNNTETMMESGDMWRAVLAPAGTMTLVMLFRYLKAKARNRWDKEGVGFLYCFSRWLGKSWARTHRASKHALTQWRVQR